MNFREPAMFLLRRNYAGAIHPALRDRIHSGDIIRKTKGQCLMEIVNTKRDRNKGGRPKKAIRMDQQLAVMCTLVERKIIEHKAKSANCSVSEYLRDLATRGQPVRKNKALPKEVLLFTGTLNHMAANLNQVAKKRNRMDELNAIERAELNELSKTVKQLADDIKNYLR